MIKVGDTVKVAGTTACGIGEEECIKIGTTCVVVDSVRDEITGKTMFGIIPEKKLPYKGYGEYWYFAKDLKKGREENRVREKVKDILITIALGVAIIIPLMGLGYAMRSDEKFVKISIEDFHNDYINMNDIVDFEATETGLMIYTSSGDSYYWER